MNAPSEARRGSVVSRDGTQIAFESRGKGLPVVLVDGAFCSRAFGPMPKLAVKLAERFTVYSYDRRGRNESGDTSPYSVDREIDDLEAVINEAGGSAYLYGASSGAVLAMRATARGLGVKKLALYEPPLVIEGSPGPVPPDRVPEIVAFVREGRRGDATKTFMRMVGTPAIFIPLMRIIPGVWSKLTAAAHTLPYDFAVLGDTGAGKPMPPELVDAMRRVNVPTLVGVGGRSPAYMHFTVETLAKTIPKAQPHVLPGQTHAVSEKAMAPLLVDYFRR
jgi:pimeloyl-ACP methyl ester carboxylesterase